MVPDEKQVSPFSCSKSVTIRRNPPRRARPTPATKPRRDFADSNLNLSEVPDFPTGELMAMDMHEKASPKPREKDPAPNSASANPNFDDSASANPNLTDLASANPNLTDSASSNPNLTYSPVNGDLLGCAAEKPSPKLPDRSMKVFLRVRPLEVSSRQSKISRLANAKIGNPRSKGGRGEKMKPEKKKTSCIQVNDCHSVSISPPSSMSRMKTEVYGGFSQVFFGDSSQEEVYAKTVSPIVEEFLSGKSGLLATLGPSGSGKTHTVFGSAREPGLVPRAIRHIFQPFDSSDDKPKRSFYLSMFEIYVENGKTEKLCDLSPDGGEIQLQSSGLKGLKEVLITEYTQAEGLIARGMLRRATATTNSNSQSSRSQCIISIRCAINKVEAQLDEAILTFVDLAGAEREKKTGNQGDRLLESNFINKSSMVFGLCLRSLLEHQKNPKKPLRKHFHGSLLTKYLRDYLEGKKRMALILTVRPAEEDYLDSSYLLRQASPFMEIKFLDKDETNKSKRRCDTMFDALAEQPKRKKTGPSAVETDKEVKTPADSTDTCEELPCDTQHEEASNTKVNDDITCKTVCADLVKERDHKVLLGFAKTIWSLLKENNQKLKTLERRNLELEKEITTLKNSCSCHKEETTMAASLVEDASSGAMTGVLKELVGCKSTSPDSNGESKCTEQRSTDVECEMNQEIEGTSLVPNGSMELVAATDVCESEPCCTEQRSANHECKSTSPDSNGESKCTEQRSTDVECELNQEVEGTSLVPNGSIELEAATDVCESDSCCTEQRSANHECKSGLKMASSSSESDELQEDQQHESCERKHSEEAAKVNGCQPANNEELERAHILKVESEQALDEGFSTGGPRGDHSLMKEDDKENCLLENSSDEMEKQTAQRCTTSKHGSNTSIPPIPEKTSVPQEKAPNKTKPKRRLMPASSVLLRQVSSLDFNDEEGTMRGRTGKSSDVEHSGTSNSSDLLRLLRVNTHR